MIRVFITDVDESLYSHKTGSVPKRNVEALYRLQEKGVLIVIATARTLKSTMNIARLLRLFEQGGYIIAGNGGEIYDCKEQKLIQRKAIAMDEVHTLYRYAQANGLHFTVEQSEFTVSSGYDSGTRIDTEIVGADFLLVGKGNDFFKWITEDPVKVNLTGEKEQIDTYFPLVEEKFSDRFYVCHAGNNFIDIVKKGVNKSTAAEALLARLGVGYQDVAAVGDGDNDSWLLSKAAYSAAVANGTALAKQAAKSLVASCEEGGLGEFIERYLLDAE